VHNGPVNFDPIDNSFNHHNYAPYKGQKAYNDALDLYNKGPISNMIELKIEKANPSTETRSVGAGTYANTTIFRHLEQAGYDKHSLEYNIPKYNSMQLDVELYNHEVWLMKDGRLEFHLPSDESEVEEEDEKCQHNFVGKDVQGSMRFLCMECDERFPRHPRLIVKEIAVSPDDQLIPVIARFREGELTLKEILTQTTLSVAQLGEALQRLFPPEIASVETIQSQTIGGYISSPIVVDTIYKEPRTSCPQKIDDFFSGRDPDRSYEFQDVTGYDKYWDETEQRYVITVEFINDSKQKVITREKLDEFSLRSAYTSMPRKPFVSTNITRKADLYRDIMSPLPQRPDVNRGWK